MSSLLVPIACDCGDLVPADSARGILCSHSFVYPGDIRGILAVVRAQSVGPGEYKLWFLPGRSFYSWKGPNVRVSRIDPFSCILPPCHHRDAHPHKDIQEALATNQQQTWYSQVSVLTVMLNVLRFVWFLTGMLLRLSTSLPSHLDFNALFGSSDLRLSFLVCTYVCMCVCVCECECTFGGT